MKIKNILGCLLVGSVAFTTTSCEDFTEIQPKGKNLLSTASQLEMLLNYNYEVTHAEWSELCGDMINASSNVASQINQPSKTKAVIRWTWDESSLGKYLEMTTSDGNYSGFYKIIGAVANPVLLNADTAEGDEAQKACIKAEALTLRAYFHWLLINKFAKAYNPATAANDPGIIYMTEEQDLLTPAPKLTVQEVYDKMLADINQAIDLNALPVEAVNRMRVSLPVAYAVKAYILNSMQQFDDAAEAARQSLALYGELNDYNNDPECQGVVTSFVMRQNYDVLYHARLKWKEDLFYICDPSFQVGKGYSPETMALIESGHASTEKIASDLLMFDYMMSSSAMSTGLMDYFFTFDIQSYWNSAGIKTSHMYLIIAEAEIQANDYDAAMKALDTIRVKRIDPEVYAPLEGTVTTKEDAIYRLKQATTGEHIYSIFSFIAKKRWNQMTGWEATYTRTINGVTYTLAPDSPFWIAPFPQNALTNNPNMSQNQDY